MGDDDILQRLQNLDADPAASSFVGDVAADAIKEIKRLRAMTTDADEGARQIADMKPEPFKVGDKVRLKAGGERVMTVAALEDYGNLAVCAWWEPKDSPEGLEPTEKRDSFPVSSLVLAE